MQKICFLFNHDQTHQIAHSLPIALQLIKSGAAEVTLAVTSPVLETEIRRLAGTDLNDIPIIRLQTKSGLSQALVRMLDGIVPARKLLIYRDNLDFFRAFDALVVSEKSSLLLKRRYGLELPIIHTRHGAGDRDIGFGRESAFFDLTLVSGPKIKDRLVKQAGVDPDRIAIVGYSKFDLCRDNKAEIAFANPERPTVIYNPHPSPHLSSWYRDGLQILEAFKRQDRYNLIFAPHVMLFSRRWTVTIDRLAIARVKQPDVKSYDLPHMHTDLGSASSNDMSYTNRADIYLGDVSSQIYEFLYKPRPCVFLNSHNVAWKDQQAYLHWRAGPVIDEASNIMAAIDQAVAEHAEYLPVQRSLLDRTFSINDRPASERAANAIDNFLQKHLMA